MPSGPHLQCIARQTGICIYQHNRGEKKRVSYVSPPFYYYYTLAQVDDLIRFHGLILQVCIAF